MRINLYTIYALSLSLSVSRYELFTDPMNNSEIMQNYSRELRIIQDNYELFTDSAEQEQTISLQNIVTTNDQFGCRFVSFCAVIVEIAISK